VPTARLFQSVSPAQNKIFTRHLQFTILSATSSLPHRRGATKNKIMPLNTPDLTQFPPRSPRVRLGGYVILPRMLDKGRATLTGKNGEYHYACPLDQRFLDFAGIDAEALKKELAKSDTEVLAWITANAKNKKTMPEIIAWSNWQENLAPNNPDGREFFNGIHKAVAPNRTDITNWFDVLDADDYVTFGGKA
jgi:hypothetical protein